MLQKKMSLRGQPNSQSLTLVSGSTPTAAPGQDLGVVITVPMSPFTGRIATIQFDFQSPAIGGNAAGVFNFDSVDIFGTDGGTLFGFRRISASSYSVQVEFEHGTTEYTIFVRRDAALLSADPNVAVPRTTDFRIVHDRGDTEASRQNRRTHAKTYHCASCAVNVRLDIRRW